MNLIFPHFLLYTFIGLLVYVLLPRFIFVQDSESVSDTFFSNYTRMTLLVILSGYFLVLTKLYEWISLVIVFGFFVIRKYYLKKSKTNRLKTFREVQLWTYDFLEGIVNLPGLAKQRIQSYLENFKAKSKAQKAFIGLVILFSACVFSFALYIRIYDAFVNAAPAMSDAYVTLAWIKYISNRILFYDGIYPQGYYIYQALIATFSSVDPLFVMKYTGPISSVLIAAGLYFSIAGFLKSKSAGLVAATSYGLFGMLFTGSWERQAATNSQEFAFLFVMPCLYYFYRYIKEKNKTDLWIGASGFAVIGLVHSLAFAYAVLGLLILGICVFVYYFRLLKVSLKGLILSGAISAAISVLPVGVGLLMGKSFHSASADFFVAAEYQAGLPNLIPSDYLALAGMLLGLIGSVFFRKNGQRAGMLFLSLFGAASFALYYWGGVLTGSLVIAARGRELFSIIAPGLIGLVFYFLFYFFAKKDPKESIRLTAAVIVAIALTILFQPKPIIPYKMEHNENVIQYMKIIKSFRPTEWLMISQEEGYAMAYGKGWHLMTGDFISEYDPSDEIYVGSSASDDQTRIPHVFVFLETEIHETYSAMKELEDIRLRRIRESVLLREWIEAYQAMNDNIELYYRNERLEVYHIYQESAYEDISDKVLGPRGE